MLHYRLDSWSKSTKAELQEHDHFILNSVWHLQKLLKNRLNRTFLNTAADQNSNGTDSGHGPHTPSCSRVSWSRLSAASLWDAACVSCSHRQATQRLLDWRSFIKIHPVTIFNWRYRRRYSEMTFTGTSVLPFSVWTHPLTIVLGSYKYLILPPLSPVFF